MVEDITEKEWIIMTSGEFTTIDVDLAEPLKMDIRLLENDHDSHRVRLPIFDYMQNNVGVERKTMQDFLSSYQGDHIWDQMNRITEHDGPSYLIISGSFNDLYPHLKGEEHQEKRDRLIKKARKSYIGAMGSIAVRYDIHPMRVDDDDELAALMTKIFHSHRHGKAGQLRKLKVSPLTKYTMPAKIIALVGGVDAKAQDIADELALETIHDVVAMKPEDLKKIYGIGKKTIDRIFEELGI